jgi:ribosomal protein L24
VGLEDEAVFSLFERATQHQIRSAFTRDSIRGAIYVECNLDTDMISLLKLTPGIIQKQSGVVRQLIDPSDWVKLLKLKDPFSVVKEGQWVRVHKGVYKGDPGFIMRVDAWGAKVLVIPRLKTPTPQADTSLKRKRTAIRPEPRLFDPTTFESMFQCKPKLQYDGSYTSRGRIFHHGLLQLNLDLHSISPNFAGVPGRILELFSSHPDVSRSEFPRPDEWIFEEGERVIVSSEKEGKIAAVESTHLDVDLATNEGIVAVSWYNVRKVFSVGDFVIVMSGPSRGLRGWVKRIADDTVHLHEYKEEGNVSTSFDDIMVSFILIPADIR